MSEMSYLKKMIVTSMLIALCVILPMAFHMIPYGLAGRALLPMHIPVLLAGLLCGPVFGLVAGILGPIISHVFTGMPPQGVVQGMVIELGVYGFVAGLVIKFIRTNRASFDLYIALIVAMLTGRVVAGAAQALFLFDGTYVMHMWISAYFAYALPGIVIQLAFLPSVVMALERERVIPLRYPVKA
ncbi:MAG: ECF transporter S component [Defluviitaleaceae bacterium]|nr:ECF transporter S component [Defluviitaleaceae bacterium]MCL2262241.1 ECF transporter S component [Defluviitaleaceae bacterium]